MKLGDLELPDHTGLHPTLSFGEKEIILRQRFEAFCKGLEQSSLRACDVDAARLIEALNSILCHNTHPAIRHLQIEFKASLVYAFELGLEEASKAAP